MRKVFAIICLLYLLTFTACQNKTIYHSYQPINPIGWERIDTLFYTFNTTSKQNTLLKSSIGIRHEDSYPYRDIWIIANQDTFHLYLADSTGKWKGKGMGNLRQIVFPVNLNLQEQDSTIKIKINHIMRENPLPGMHDIGIHIENLQTNE